MNGLRDEHRNPPRHGQKVGSKAKIANKFWRAQSVMGLLPCLRMWISRISLCQKVRRKAKFALIWTKRPGRWDSCSISNSSFVCTARLQTGRLPRHHGFCDGHDVSSVKSVTRVSYLGAASFVLYTKCLLVKRLPLASPSDQVHRWFDRSQKAATDLKESAGEKSPPGPSLKQAIRGPSCQPLRPGYLSEYIQNHGPPSAPD